MAKCVLTSACWYSSCSVVNLITSNLVYVCIEETYALCKIDLCRFMETTIWYTYNHMTIWLYDDLIIWSYDHMIVWSYDQSWSLLCFFVCCLQRLISTLHLCLPLAKADLYFAPLSAACNGWSLLCFFACFLQRLISALLLCLLLAKADLCFAALPAACRILRPYSLWTYTSSMIKWASAGDSDSDDDWLPGIPLFPCGRPIDPPPMATAGCVTNHGSLRPRIAQTCLFRCWTCGCKSVSQHL